MLCMTKSSPQYVATCRKRIDSQISVYRKLDKAATGVRGGSEGPLDSAIQTFEPVFFNNMVLVLENSFVHRSRTLEKKDGNPLNEVRVLSNSMMTNNGVMVADTQIKLDPAKSLLSYRVGDRIKVHEEDFVLLS